MDWERPENTGGGGNGRRRDLAPWARGRIGLIVSPATDLSFNRRSKRGISCRICGKEGQPLTDTQTT